MGQPPTDSQSPELPLEPFAVLSKEAGDRFWQNAISLFPKVSDVTTDTLYHYTTLAGFMSIVQQNCLWASNFAYLNDETELWHGKKILRDLIEEKQYLTPHRYSESTQKIVAAFQNTILQQIVHAYGTCFSSLDDSLSQWRGYGQGVSIGFDRRILESYFFENVRLEKISYSVSDGKRILEHLLEAFLSVTQENEERSDKQQMLSFMTNSFQNYAELTFPMLKHDAFQTEHEWRLLDIRNPLDILDARTEVKFRIRGDMLIPYLELRPKADVKLPIKSVRIGPTDRMAGHLHASVSLFLFKHGYQNITIESSKIPFRP